MFREVFIEFLVGKGRMGRQRHLGNFEIQAPAEFLVTKVGGVLVRHSFFYEQLIGDCERELTVFRLGINNAIKIFPAARYQLESQVLNLHRRLLPGGLRPASSQVTRTRAQSIVLELHHVLGLQPLGAFRYREPHSLAFGERFESLRLNGRVVNENVVPGRALDKTVTLRVVKPLYCTLFFFTHLVSLFPLS